MRLKYLDLDSSILDYQSGLVEIEDNDTIDIVSFFLSEAIKNTYKFLTIKINADKIELINEFLRQGAKLIDTELTFEKKKNVLFKFMPDDGLKFEKNERYWDDRLYEITKTITKSRFFADKKIDANLALKLWNESIYNSCNGRANYSIICLDNDLPVGLMNVFESDSISDIFFIAFLPQYQGIGLGKKMLAFYESNLDQTVKVQKVETQSINYSAQGLYTSLGYKNTNTKHILHLWL